MQPAGSRPAAPAPPANSACIAMGGQCLSPSAPYGPVVCPAGTHEARPPEPAYDSCGYFSSPTNDNCCTGGCYELGRPGIAAAPVPCCLPGASPDGGVDSGDAASDAQSGAPPPA